jgi:arginine deiminase
MPPLPNTLYTRDTTCWLYDGLTLNPLFWPARHDETLIYKAIYRLHPSSWTRQCRVLVRTTGFCHLAGFAP